MEFLPVFYLKYCQYGKRIFSGLFYKSLSENHASYNQNLFYIWSKHVQNSRKFIIISLKFCRVLSLLQLLLLFVSLQHCNMSFFAISAHDSSHFSTSPQLSLKASISYVREIWICGSIGVGHTSLEGGEVTGCKTLFQFFFQN